jgi:hypothetical protein
MLFRDMAVNFATHEESLFQRVEAADDKTNLMAREASNTDAAVARRDTTVLPEDGTEQRLKHTNPETFVKGRLYETGMDKDDS